MYKNATMPNSDWLQNEAGLISDWQPQYLEIKLKDYYRITCNNVREVFYMRPTNAQIEQFIKTGEYSHTDRTGRNRRIASPVTSAEERVYLFKMAQAKQLTYDISRGRAAIVGDGNVICADSADCLKQLGLYQRTEFSI